MRLPYLLCMFLVLTACEQVVEVDIPAHQSRLVINALSRPDTSFRFVVSRSEGIFGEIDPARRLLDDIDLKLYRGGNLLDQLTYKDTLLPDEQGEQLRMHGYFAAAGLRPVAGQTYRITAYHPDYPPVEAAVVQPENIVLSSARLQPDQLRDPQGRPVAGLSLSWPDPPGQRNFYAMTLSMYYAQVEGGDTLYFAEENIPYYSLVEIQRLSLRPLRAFDDAGFDGEQAEPVYYLYLPISLDADLNYVIDSFKVEFRHCNEAYFQYAVNFDAHVAGQNASFNLFSSETLPFYSNIRHGYGVWAAYSATQNLATVEE